MVKILLIQLTSSIERINDDSILSLLILNVTKLDLNNVDHGCLICSSGASSPSLMVDLNFIQYAFDLVFRMNCIVDLDRIRRKCVYVGTILIILRTLEIQE